MEYQGGAQGQAHKKKTQESRGGRKKVRENQPSLNGWTKKTSITLAEYRGSKKDRSVEGITGVGTKKKSEMWRTAKLQKS